MNITVTKKSLSSARQRLLRIMQELDYGRIEELDIRGGQPDFARPPRVLREVPIGRQGRPRPEVDLANFELKHDVMVLFKQLEGVGEGQVGIKVERGLPVKLLYEIPAAK